LGSEGVIEVSCKQDTAQASHMQEGFWIINIYSDIGGGLSSSSKYGTQHLLTTYLYLLSLQTGGLFFRSTRSAQADASANGSGRLESRR
jgi:hypothetical protein